MRFRKKFHDMVTLFLVFFVLAVHGASETDKAGSGKSPLIARVFLANPVRVGEELTGFLFAFDTDPEKLSDEQKRLIAILRQRKWPDISDDNVRKMLQWRGESVRAEMRAKIEARVEDAKRERLEGDASSGGGTPVQPERPEVPPKKKNTKAGSDSMAGVNEETVRLIRESQGADFAAACARVLRTGDLAAGCSEHYEHQDESSDDSSDPLAGVYRRMSGDPPQAPDPVPVKKKKKRNRKKKKKGKNPAEDDPLAPRVQATAMSGYPKEVREAAEVD